MSGIDEMVKAVYENGKVPLATTKIKINGWGNFRNFLMELHDFLVAANFVDNLNPGIDTNRPEEVGGGNVMLKSGEFPDTGKYFNRTPDMFEREFRDVDLGGGKEYEVSWEAVQKMGNSNFKNAKFFFQFKVVNRFCPTKEFEENGKKVEKQGGTWEFESKYHYICDINYKLDNIPVIGHWNWTRVLYFKHFFAKFVKKDIEDGFKMVGKLRSIPNKYFSMYK